MGKKPNPPTPFPGREGGEYFPPLLAGEGSGQRSSAHLLFTHIFKLDALLLWSTEIKTAVSAFL
ncbi:hypothetical protein AFK68_05570 [Hydrocoleum sp. CS-953]|nr:hypothetical protein AFK68_05570 [Hydrocoleum sp. CS-953]